MSAGCTFCGNEIKGGMGMRDPKLLRIQYCVDHRAHAQALWAKYEHLLQLIAEGAPLSEGGDP
jgi:hypothetical protein